jgi:hypothetical protein
MSLKHGACRRNSSDLSGKHNTPVYACMCLENENCTALIWLKLCLAELLEKYFFCQQKENQKVNQTQGKGEVGLNVGPDCQFHVNAE